MAIEIERKFLVAAPVWQRSVRRRIPMLQGYLTGLGGAASVRVRLEGRVARLNIKAAVRGAKRAEFEYPIPVRDARELLRLCATRVEKVRHHVRHGGLLWEIDVFAGANRGLVVAEVELRHPRQKFKRPPWAGREVTHLKRYYNHALALHPYSRWHEKDRH